MNEILPGFTTNASGKLGVGILKEHFGRAGVLRTHPVNDDISCILSGQFLIPAETKTQLLIDVSHDAHGEWRLIVRANGQQVLKTVVSSKTCKDGWATFKVDLSKFAGQDVRLTLENEPDVLFSFPQSQIKVAMFKLATRNRFHCVEVGDGRPRTFEVPVM